jgi:Fe-S-cluster containining protein
VIVGSICGACAEENGRVCCEVAPGEKLATLTAADIERLEETTGLPAHRFAEREALDRTAARAYETARPLYRGLFANGFRYGLKARRGACVFFDPGKGCRLPADARPVACHLYPFDFDEVGKLTAVEAPHCLALERSRGKPDLIGLFHTTPRRLDALRDQAREEVSAHAAGMRRLGGSRR